MLVGVKRARPKTPMLYDITWLREEEQVLHRGGICLGPLWHQTVVASDVETDRDRLVGTQSGQNALGALREGEDMLLREVGPEVQYAEAAHDVIHHGDDRDDDEESHRG